MSDEKVLTLSLDVDNATLAALAGPMDANLRQIETILNVTISRRGHTLRF